MISRTILSHILLFNNRFVVSRGLKILNASLGHLLALLRDKEFAMIHDMIRTEARKALPEIQTLLSCHLKFNTLKVELNAEEKEILESFAGTQDHLSLLGDSLKSIRLFTLCYPEVAMQHLIDFTKILQNPFEELGTDVQIEILEIFKLVPQFKWTSRAHFLHS